MIMPRLKKKLQTLLKNARRVAILGIGSELRGDDIVGLLVLDHLRKLKTKSVGCCPHGKSKIVAGVDDPGPASARPATVFGCPNRASRSGPIFKFFNGGTAPENLTGEIRRFKPSHLIMIDAVELGKRPGTIALIDINPNISQAMSNISPTGFDVNNLRCSCSGLTLSKPLQRSVETSTRELSLAEVLIKRARECSCNKQVKKVENTAFLTHKLPVKLMLDYLAAEMSFTTIFIGIQPKNLDFGAPVSKPVIRAARELAGLLIKGI